MLPKLAQSHPVVDRAEADSREVPLRTHARPAHFLSVPERTIHSSEAASTSPETRPVALCVVWVAEPHHSYIALA
jgi:hypothetical protein